MTRLRTSPPDRRWSHPRLRHDALEVLDRFALRNAVPEAVVALLAVAGDDPPDDDVWAAACTTRVIANNRTAVEAAVIELRSRAYQVEVAAEPLVGEAADRGREIAAAARTMESTTPTAVVMGGETTVTVRASGSGGRNQELALAAAIGIEDAGKIVVLAAGTDGIDGRSNNAGASSTPTTVSRFRKFGLDPEAFLDDQRQRHRPRGRGRCHSNRAHRHQCMRCHPGADGTANR